MKAFIQFIINLFIIKYLINIIRNLEDLELWIGFFKVAIQILNVIIRDIHPTSCKLSWYL